MNEIDFLDFETKKSMIEDDFTCHLSPRRP